MSTRDSDIPAGAIELRSTSKLRDHPSAGLVPEIRPEDYRSLRADIERRGLQEPLEITAEDVVLNGHLRLRAARELRLDSVPVRIVAPVDEVEHMLLAALHIATCRPRSGRRSSSSSTSTERSGTRQGSADSRTCARTPRWQICHLGEDTRARRQVGRGLASQRPIRRHRPRARPRPVRQGQSRRTRC